MTETSFQRARTPEQIAARRAAILDAAEELLTELPTEQVSLRELSRRVGLGTANVARYFPTREAVFLEVLDRARGLWLDELEERVTGDAHELARTFAESLQERPLVCELLSVVARVLERNVDRETVLDFKLRSRAHNERLGRLFARAIPGLTEAQGLELSSHALLLVMAAWPVANPNDAVREAMEDPRLAPTRVNFVDRITRLLELLIGGLRAQD
ncbi:AcrR family transcriptional regulator [Crossiella equi]|uniref:AcrR family transcriptional regulator n=1 Tax=Crossiella equi TaxID=130796 RepID=A0ABS5APY6_9PSEU|nr:TetR family transcriptional regulator [Crossiella equi]MBP2478634.1 AcrR family transcriptional regulator [Crossiella equi]